MSSYCKIEKKAYVYFIVFFCFSFIIPNPTISKIEAGTLLNEKIDWKPAEYVDNRQEGRSIPFKITGPGVLQIRWTIEPFFCVSYFNKSDSVLAIPGLWNYDWKLMSSKHLYNNKPLETYNVASPCYLEGKIKKATFFDEFEIPAKQYAGKFEITSPMICGLNSCNRRGAAFWAEAKFIPGKTQTASTSGSVPQTPDSQDTYSSSVDIRGTWVFGAGGETWTFTPLGGNRYKAQEKGFGNAWGTAEVKGKNFRLDFTFSGGSGYFLGTISSDGNSIQTIRYHDGKRFTFKRTATGGTTTAPIPPSSGNIVNLALRKPATQSSIYRGTGLDHGPHFGVDGILKPQPKDPYLMVHTNADSPSWWQVDLQNVHKLTELKLYNRRACCGERAGTVQVFLSKDGANWERVYARDGNSFEVLRIDLKGKTARYVKLQLNEKNYLHFYECEVFGYSSPVKR